MTNEEAIKHITTWLYAAPALPPMQVVQALELAVNALRAGGTDMNVPTMPAGQPLTLDQLCRIEGKKVLIYRMKSTEPLEPGTVKMNGDVLGDNGTLAYHELYLLTWAAFSYPTANINREAWMAKWVEDGECNHKPCRVRDREKWKKYKCSKCGYKAGRRTGQKFCPSCGRAMTPEAWAELEKRVRG